MEQYVGDNIQSPAFYLQSGLFEPVHLQQNETEVLTQGMAETLEKCFDETGYSCKLFYEATKQTSEALDEQNT